MNASEDILTATNPDWIQARGSFVARSREKAQEQIQVLARECVFVFGWVIECDWF
jgi:hypothetical protein